MEISEQVHLKRRLVSARLQEASTRLWNHPELKALYPSILFRIHCMARATVPLMETAVERLRVMPATDPVVKPLIDYLSQQIPQEQGHDNWLLEDLEALGVPREQTLQRMPPPTVAALIGAQYYWIRHHHPVALLGYIAVVEAGTPTVELIDRIVAQTGLPRAAFRNFLRHAVLEPAHNESLDRFLDSLPLTREQLGLIGVSLIQTANLNARAAEEILEFHELAKAMPGCSPLDVVKGVECPEIQLH